MDGFRVHNRLITVGTHVEMLHVRLAAGNILVTDRLNEKLVHAVGLLPLLREAQERLFIVLQNFVFHCFSPFLLLNWVVGVRRVCKSSQFVGSGCRRHTPRSGIVLSS